MPELHQSSFTIHSEEEWLGCSLIGHRRSNVIPQSLEALLREVPALLTEDHVFLDNGGLVTSRNPNRKYLSRVVRILEHSRVSKRSPELRTKEILGLASPVWLTRARSTGLAR